MIEVVIMGDDEENGKFYKAKIKGKFTFKAETIEDFDLEMIIEELGQRIRSEYKEFVDWQERSLKWHTEHAEYSMKGSRHASSYSPDYGDQE